MKFIKRQHSGRLKESLQTEQEITQDEFNYEIRKYYTYYGYDPRCKEYLWILTNMTEYASKKPTWLGICLRD